MKYEIKKEEEEEKHLSSIVFGLGFWGGGGEDKSDILYHYWNPCGSYWCWKDVFFFGYCMSLIM